MSRPRRRLPLALAAGGAFAATAGLVVHLGKTAGATRVERSRKLPGDGIVAAPDVVTTHAISIAAPPADVWPWLVQMGYHRGGWYTYPWVDRLVFHMTNPSAERIVPELQDVAVGDIIPDGPPGTAWYVVHELVPDHHLVLHSTTHDAPWRSRPGVWVDWTWTFVLEQEAAGRTRLIVRARIACGPGWLRLLCHAVIVPGDLVMSHSQRRGIRRRAEATGRRTTSSIS